MHWFWISRRINKFSKNDLMLSFVIVLGSILSSFLKLKRRSFKTIFFTVVSDILPISSKFVNNFFLIKLIDKKLLFALISSSLIKSICVALSFCCLEKCAKTFFMIARIFLVLLIILFTTNESSENIDERVWILYLLSSWSSETNFWICWSTCFNSESKSGESSNSDEVFIWGEGLLEFDQYSTSNLLIISMFDSDTPSKKSRTCLNSLFLFAPSAIPTGITLVELSISALTLSLASERILRLISFNWKLFQMQGR